MSVAVKNAFLWEGTTYGYEASIHLFWRWER